MSCGSSRVQNSSKNKTFNKKIFSEIELSLVQKYLKLKCDEQNKKRIINESLRRKVLRRRALEAIPKIKVVRNLTNFKILPRETEQIESIPLPKTPEPSVSNANLKLLIDSHKTKDALEILGFSHIITIYVGNTIVKHAFSAYLNRQVAIKTVSRPSYKGEKYKWLENELESVLTLQHKNLLMIYQYFLTNHEIHIIMEYQKNGSLTDLIKYLSFIPEFITQKMFKGLSHGLQFCHEKGIFHRNITCDNIYVSGRMHLKLANFHLIKKSPDDIKNPLGTFMYTAPEVRNRLSKSGFLADMWSMGLVLYVMLFGKYPYSVTVYKQLDDKSSLYELKPSKHIMATHEALLVISKLLCPPSERISIKQLLDNPWFDLILSAKDFIAVEKKKIHPEEGEDTVVKKVKPKSAIARSKDCFKRVLNNKCFLDSCFKNKKRVIKKK